MARRRDSSPRKRRDYKKKEGEKNMNAKKCPHCGSVMKCKGTKGCAGTIYWKCKNKVCGRTLDIRKEPSKPVIPLTY